MNAVNVINDLHAFDFVTGVSFRDGKAHVTVGADTSAKEVAAMAEHCGARITHIQGEEVGEGIVVVLAFEE